jgi:hypothetical protein
MSKYHHANGPEEALETSADREKELSGQFDDPGFDFIFEDQAS